MNEQKENWEKYKVEIGDIVFRPVSMATLTMLYDISSPLVVGGEMSALDYCVFAWMHAAPIMEVVTSIAAKNYTHDAILWGANVPPIVFSSYTLPTMKQLEKDLKLIFIDKKSGFLPFPVPSQCKVSCLKRAIHFLKHLLGFGSHTH